MNLKLGINHKIGYSDHTLGTIPIAAVCKGAQVIEKHFTLSKKMYGSDARFSSEPDEMKYLVDSIRAVNKALQSQIDKDQKATSLISMKMTFEKMIVAHHDLPQGKIIKESDLAFKKPMEGIPANEVFNVVGKKTIKYFSKIHLFHSYSKMRKANIALLTSTHLRHRYVANKINDFFNLKVIVKEDKGNAYQHKGSNHSETQVLRDHFQSLADSEQRFFSDSKWPTDCLTINLERGSINSERVLNALLGAKCDYVAVFGCGIINDDIISQFNGRIINAHQGLSPYYRGSATNFWPFVNNELQFVGVTMHYIDKGIDTGNIVVMGVL